MKWLAPLLATAVLTCAAEDPPPPEIEKAVETLKTELAAKLAKIDQAITTAAKEGGLKPSTEAYFRDCLTHFQTSPAGLSEAERIYFPPRFDSTPAMEPINLAWADLRAEITRQQREQDKLVARAQGLVGESLNTAANRAERAEDLVAVTSALDLLEKVYDPSRAQRFYGLEPEVREQISAARTVVKGMAELLSARQAKEQVRLTQLLKGMAAQRQSYSSARSVTVSAAQEVFRQRMLQPFRQEMLQAQTRLEEALIARKSPAEIDEALRAYQTLSAGLQDTAGQEERNYTPNLLRTYQSAAAGLAALAAGSEGQVEPPNQYDVLPLARPVQYQAFLLQLQQDLRHREELPRESAPAGVEKVRAELRAKLATVQDAAGALALAETFSNAVPPRLRDDAGQWQTLRSQLQTTEQQLRLLATQWQEGSIRPSGFREYQDGHEGGFAPELLKLRDRAVRQTLASTQDLPELLQAPLAEQPIKVALRKLADAAADRGEWKKTFALLPLLTEEIDGRGLGAPGQAQAIHAYLTGLNYEQAEQFPQAIAAYLQVLTVVAEHVPLAESTARLKKLRSEHPEAFDRRPGSLRNSFPGE